MPTTGPLRTFKGTENKPEEGYRSRYSHDTEITQAGYYSVYLQDYQVKVELTSAPRSGILRFTYPESEKSRIQIDLARRIGGTSDEQYVEKVDEYTIRGWMKCTPNTVFRQWAIETAIEVNGIIRFTRAISPTSTSGRAFHPSPNRIFVYFFHILFIGCATNSTGQIDLDT